MAGVQICETVTGANMVELRRNRDAAGRADLVELRLDGVEDADVAGALAGRRTPVVVTCRPAWDGGRFDGSEEARRRLLGDAVRLGAEYVDVEDRADWRLPRAERTGLVLSFHDWQGVPEDLDARVRHMRQSDAAITKVAVTARLLSDCLKLRAATRGDRAIVAIAMGHRGRVSRTCPWLFGSCWCYAGQAAPGQLTTDELIDRYRVRSGSVRTVLYGVTGRPLGHSASPAMHNAAFATSGLDAVYVALEADTAEQVDEVATALDVRGLSVTAPFKREFLSRAIRADARASALGAANTLRRVDGGWEAANFDADGFADPLDRDGHVLAGKRAVVLGAGGAARAVTFALKTRGALVSVSARNSAEAARVAEELGVTVGAWPPGHGWDLVVNATPVGMWPDESAMPLLPAAVSGAVAYDLVYNPPDTVWLRAARETGAVTIGGLDMLVGQASRQFEWWTGQPAPRTAIRNAAHRFVTVEVRESHEANDV